MLEIKESHILLYRIFDVGWEIDIKGLEKEIKGNRLKISKLGPRSVYFRYPPFTVHLGENVFHFEKEALKYEIFVRFYNFGAITILFRFNLKNITFKKLKEIFWFLWNNGEIIHIMKKYLKEIFEKYKKFINQPKIYEDFEDMYVLYVREFKNKIKSNELLKLIDFSELLTGERYKLSDSIKNEFKNNLFSYSEEDIAVLNWDTAFIYDTEGLMDIPNIIEFCNVMLLELRYFDSYLDFVLQKTYDIIETPNSEIKLFLKYKNFGNEMKKLLRLHLDITEAFDKVINGLKIFEDTYYRKIYNRMISILGIPEWERNVLNKQKTIMETYSLLNNEISNIKFYILEILIIVAILIEFIAYLIKG